MGAHVGARAGGVIPDVGAAEGVQIVGARQGESASRQVRTFVASAKDCITGLSTSFDRMSVRILLVPAAACGLDKKPTK